MKYTLKLDHAPSSTLGTWTASPCTHLKTKLPTARLAPTGTSGPCAVQRRALTPFRHRNPCVLQTRYPAAADPTGATKAEQTSATAAASK